MEAETKPENISIKTEVTSLDDILYLNTSPLRAEIKTEFTSLDDRTYVNVSSHVIKVGTKGFKTADVNLPPSEPQLSRTRGNNMSSTLTTESESELSYGTGKDLGTSDSDTITPTLGPKGTISEKGETPKKRKRHGGAGARRLRDERRTAGAGPGTSAGGTLPPPPDHYSKIKEATTTPSPRDVKKPSRVAASFAQIASCFDVAIVPHGYPANILNKEDVQEILEKISDHITASVGAEELPCPRIEGHVLRAGGMVMSCSGEGSKVWFEKTVGGMGPLRQGTMLRAGGTDILDRLVRIGGFFPGPMPTKSLLMRKLGKQNHVLDDRRCAVVSARECKGGFYSILLLPESSMADLRQHGMRLHYNFGVVRVEVVEKRRKKKRQGSPPGHCGRQTERAGKSSLPPH